VRVLEKPMILMTIMTQDSYSLSVDDLKILERELGTSVINVISVMPSASELNAGAVC
jgi:hypothetical protein